MADFFRRKVHVMHCKRFVKAFETRLESNENVYSAQLAYDGYCRHCQTEFILWRGLYPTDSYTVFIEVKKPLEYQAWKRRIAAGEHRPRVSHLSDYTRKVSNGRNIDAVGVYLHRIDRAVV